MKTGISIPDDVFEAAERAAKKLGVSRSELYANAVREFVERYRRENVTAELNKIYSEDQAHSAVDPMLASMQSQSLPREEW